MSSSSSSGYQRLTETQLSENDAEIKVQTKILPSKAGPNTSLVKMQNPYITKNGLSEMIIDACVQADQIPQERLEYNFLSNYQPDHMMPKNYDVSLK